MVMKLKGLLTVAMMVGALSAMGCKSTQADSGEVAPDENPETAPVVTQPIDTAKPQAAEHEHAGNHPATESYSYFGVRGYAAPMAPPAVKVEVMGTAPSPRHIWAPGYWRWSGREYLWSPGRWIVRREGFTWLNPHWENRYSHWYYIPGHWRRF